jgi:uncharacterized protein
MTPEEARPDPTDPDHAAALLARSRTIAVVGFSVDPTRPAYFAPMELVRRGWDVVPVNPFHDEIAGLATVASLEDIDRPIDLVDVFRPAAEAPQIVRQAIEVGAKAVWLQQGIRSEQARAIAAAAGIDYVEDQCVGPIARGHDLSPPPPSH